MAARSWVVVLATSVLVLGACGDDDDTASTDRPATTVTTGPPTTDVTAPPTTATADTTTPTTPTTPTGAAASTSPLTTTPTTSAPGTTAPATTEARRPCRDPFTSTSPVDDGFPERMSSLVGAAIRTGAHPCFERVVLELQGEGELPGYQVQYVDDPVHLSPSDQTVEIAGEATLVLQVASWMTSMEGEGYDGPTRITPTNVEHVLELRMTENFEGLTAWAIGLDEERPFVVDTLTDPPRVVVDIWTG